MLSSFSPPIYLSLILLGHCLVSGNTSVYILLGCHCILRHVSAASFFLILSAFLLSRFLWWSIMTYQIIESFISIESVVLVVLDARYVPVDIFYLCDSDIIIVQGDFFLCPLVLRTPEPDPLSKVLDLLFSFLTWEWDAIFACQLLMLQLLYSDLVAALW